MIHRKDGAEIEYLAHQKAYNDAAHAAAFAFQAGGDGKALAYQVYATNYPMHVLGYRAAEDAVQTYQEALGELQKPLSESDKEKMRAAAIEAIKKLAEAGE